MIVITPSTEGVSASATAPALGLVGLFLGADLSSPVGDQPIRQADVRRQAGEHPRQFALSRHSAALWPQG
jgi:hypothetical protein